MIWLVLTLTNGKPHLTQISKANEIAYPKHDLALMGAGAAIDFGNGPEEILCVKETPGQIAEALDFALKNAGGPGIQRSWPPEDERCPACKGRGRVASSDEDDEPCTVRCTDCDGFGFGHGL